MILKAKNIFKKYENTAVLSGVSLDVEMGESIAICGRSGEGKTTLLHILAALSTPDSGEIEIGGVILNRSNAARIRGSEIGIIFQSYNLLEDFSALENVLMPARIARKSAHRSMGMELLSMVHLEHKADLLAKFLSGGERQRVAIARALCNNPKIIFADEPTGNLDRENGRKIAQMLIHLKRTFILVTHDPELASLCQTEYLLKEGALIKMIG